MEGFPHTLGELVICNKARERSASRRFQLDLCLWNQVSRLVPGEVRRPTSAPVLPLAVNALSTLGGEPVDACLLVVFPHVRVHYPANE